MLSRRVKELRESAGWSQKELAEKAKVSQQLIGKIEAGRVRESRKLPLIAAAFGLTVEEMLLLDGPSAKPRDAKQSADYPLPIPRGLFDGLSRDQIADIAGMVEDRVARLKARGSIRRKKSSAA